MLYKNKINEIKGLENLKDLKIVSFQSNRIMEIKGFDNLNNLEEVTLGDNPLDKDHVNQFEKSLQASRVKTKFYYPW